MYWVYILHSQSTDRFYCGHTGDLDNRLRQHNDPAYPFTQTTKRIAGPWQLIWQRECATRRDAMTLEKRIKKQGIGRFLERSIGRVPPEAGLTGGL